MTTRAPRWAAGHRRVPGAPPDEEIEAALTVLRAAPTDRVNGLAITRTGADPGTAPTLLLVHGVGASRAAWAPLVPLLKDRYDLIVIDLPGHGDSDPLPARAPSHPAALARRVEEAMVEVGTSPAGRPHVVGNSLGGWVSLELAADGAASSVTALAPAGLRRRPVPPGPILRGNRTLARRTRGLVDPWLGVAAVRRAVLATGSSAPAQVHPGVARAMVAAMAGAIDYERMLDAACRRRFERARQLHVPVTVAFGDRDWILPRAAQRREMVPAGTRWVRLDRCGHAPMWDQPVRVCDLIDETVSAAGGA